MQPTPSATIARRLLSASYDALLLAAVLWCAALPLQLVEASFGAPHNRMLFQVYLVLVAGVYFVPQWVRGGQTLAMKTWRLRLVDIDGRAVNVRQATLRYVAALAGAALAGMGFIWAFVDPQRQFLHDRIARTRIVRLPEPKLEIPER